jgi:predicted  nucleic acid-binding Zn-ribbon protein
LAGDKRLDKPNGDRKNARLDGAIATLQGAKAIFPLAETMAEGLMGVQESAVEAVRGDVAAVRSQASGFTTLVADVKRKAEKIERDAASAAGAAAELKGTKESIETAAAAATKATAALETLTVTVGENTYTGVEALGVVGDLVTAIPEVVKAAVGEVVSAEVGEGEDKRTVRGSALITDLVIRTEGAEKAAGKAVADAEHASELINEAGDLVNQAQGAAAKAEEEASDAKAEVEKLKAQLEACNTELAGAKRDLEVLTAIVFTIAEKNGLAGLSGEELAAIQASVPETTNKSDATKEGA